ncbi:hypothetical protein K0B04_01810 [Patescibacteria group bacterium]|nr:hypothetical protein [Patescibacteria group bacterium]
MKDALNIERYDDLKQQAEKARASEDKSSLESVKTTLEDKTKIPTNKEIVETHGGLCKERVDLDLEIAKRCMGSESGRLVDYRQVEPGDNRIRWKEGESVVFKPVMRDERSRLERLFNKPPRMVETGEVTAYFRLHTNDTAPKDTTVVVITTKAIDGKIDLKAISDNKISALLKLTNQTDINKAYSGDSNSLESQFIRGMSQEEYHKKFSQQPSQGPKGKNVKQSLNDYWKNSDERYSGPSGLKATSAEEWRRMEMQEDMLNRLGEKYKNLLEDSVKWHDEIVKKTESDLNQAKKENEGTKEEVKKLSPPSSDEKGAKNTTSENQGNKEEEMKKQIEALEIRALEMRLQAEQFALDIQKLELEVRKLKSSGKYDEAKKIEEKIRDIKKSLNYSFSGGGNARGRASR